MEKKKKKSKSMDNIKHDQKDKRVHAISILCTNIFD